MCREKKVGDFFKVKRFKFNEVIKNNFKIYFPFIKIVFHWFKGSWLKIRFFFNVVPNRTKHTFQRQELFLMGGMQNYMFVKTFPGPDVIMYSPIPL